MENITGLVNFVGNSTYGALALVALWGAYCVTMVWLRVGQKRFRNEATQGAFLQAIEESLARGDFDSAIGYCDGDRRALPQLVQLGINNRHLGYQRMRQLVLDRFQRDVLADLDYRLTWVNTVVKTAPMLGLFGTVVGMMGAFAKLAVAENVKATALASDIYVALITTALGLAIAIPLVMLTAAIGVRISKLEEQSTLGLGQFFEFMKTMLGKGPPKPPRSAPGVEHESSAWR